MTLFHLPFTAAPSSDPGDVPTPIDPHVEARFDVVDGKLDLIMTRTLDVLGEVQALGRRVEAIVADNAAAAAERAR